MEQCDTLIAARWCLPVEPAGIVLTDHAVAVRDGRIVAVLPKEQARARFEAGVDLERDAHVLIPGFCNAHTHAAMTLLRGYADDMPLERWLRDSIWPAERRWVSAEMVRDGTRHAVVEMLKSGTTCFGDQYFFPETVAEAAADMQIRAVVATPVVDFETAWARNGPDCLARAADLVHDAYADHPLITTAFAPHSTDAVGDATFQSLRVLADQLDRPVQIHLHETRAEIERSLADCGERPLARLERLGLLNASLLAVHGVHLDDAEIAGLSAAGVAVVHCPRSNLKLASGVARTTELRDAGITVALGTDGAASNNVLDMFGEMRTASLLAKGVGGDPEALGAHEALRMATLDGARALRLDESIGSIVAGKRADLACIDLSHVRSQPVYDPASQLVYTCAADQVSDVWVDGRHLVENGGLTAADEREVIERSREWQMKIGAAPAPATSGDP